MSSRVNRRSFLKILGLGGVGSGLAGCDMPSTVTLEEGKEDVVSYLMPEEYVIPGVGVWYASACLQCAAGCGVHGRVREGRPLKLEGNPEASVNGGKLCMMGQAALQGHYNPDRVTKPMIREGGKLREASWEETWKLINGKLGKDAAVTADRVAWFTGNISGHQAVLVKAHLQSLGSKRHYVHEVVNVETWQAVNRDMLGEAMPRLRMDKANVILSLGADFLGAWLSPVHFSREYAKFRTGKSRGTLIQVESKMSLTGGSADRWLPIKPGTEGLLVLAIANLLLNKHHLSDKGVLASLRKQIDDINLNNVARTTGVVGDRIQRMAAVLAERGPSLVLAGPQMDYASTAATMALNIILGNVGKTIESAGEAQLSDLAMVTGGSADLLRFANAAQSKRLDAVFFWGSNPAFSAPAALKMQDALAAVPLKIVLTQFMDETAELADVVIPLASALEDWGTHMGIYPGDGHQLVLQQPLMEKLYDQTVGFGDFLLSLLKERRAQEFGKFADYYGYLRNVFEAMPASMKNSRSGEQFWNASLQSGVLSMKSSAGSLKLNIPDVVISKAGQDSSSSLSLVATARLGLWDGRHANLPWLQEAPDQISKVVWDSWAEIHPTTAEKLNIKQGDYLQVASAGGEVKVKAYLFKGVHPDVVAIPLGQGHESYGRYASKVGVNPLNILNLNSDAKSGELALNGTLVSVSKTGDSDKVVKMGNDGSQAGRRMVVTISADVLRRTEGV